MLEETIRQVAHSDIKKVIVATPDREIFATITPQTGIYEDTRRPVHAFAWMGDENDLIGRYYVAACRYKAEPIVRITADCPLILPEVINLVVQEYFDNPCNYAYNRCDGSENGWLDGLDVEVFDFLLLECAYRMAKEREHMTWLRDNATVHIVKPDKDYGPCTSINTEADYQKALQILRGRQNGDTSIR